MGKAEDRVTKGLFSVSRPHLRHRAWLYALLAVAVLAISFRLALNPVARHVSHRALDSMVGYRGNFDDVTVSLLRLRLKCRAQGFMPLHQQPEAFFKMCNADFAAQPDTSAHMQRRIARHDLLENEEPLLRCACR